MKNEFFNLVKPYIVPVVVVLFATYFKIGTLETQMKEIKISVAVIADQQIQIAQLFEITKNHEQDIKEIKGRL